MHLKFILLAAVAAYLFCECLHKNLEGYKGMVTKHDRVNYQAVPPDMLDSGTVKVKGYRVQAMGTVESTVRVAEALASIKMKTDSIVRPKNFHALMEHPSTKTMLTPRLEAGMGLLHRMHFSKSGYVEIPPTTGFYGVNYPFGVHNEANTMPLGADKRLRATKRVVYLTLRHSPNRFRSREFVKDLVIHELAHTVANHVQYRPDDHGPDFEAAEMLLKHLWALSDKLNLK